MTGNINEYSRNSLIMYRFFNWNDLFILTGDSELDIIRYGIYTKSFGEMGVNVVNPEEYRFLPENYTRADFEKYKHIFEYIRDTKCRVIVILITTPGFVYEALYEVGLRRGDLIIISPLKNFYTAEDEPNIKLRDKQFEILDGSLTLGFLEYDTDHGKEIEKELKKRYSPIVNMCNTHDAFLTISNSIKYLIKKGEDYEDPHLLISSMRNQRFVGCSGDVFFINDQNSRSTQWANYFQVQINSSTNNYDFMPFLALSKFSVLAARQINKPIWATGENLTPTNYRIPSKCVYSKDKQKSKYGLIQLHVVSMILLLIVLIVAFYSQKTFNESIPQITETTIQSYHDMLYQFFFICEFFQILSLDPKNGIITEITREYNYLTGLNILEFFNFKNDEFWIFESWLISISFAYSLLVVVTIIIKVKYIKIASYFENILETILPIIGHITFMPLISMLMTIYQCEEGVSDTLTDSFLSRDCTNYCYREKHLNYMIPSSISFALLLFISTFMRPYWETIQPGLRIRARPAYWSILSIFQVVLVLIKVNLSSYSRAVSGYLICGVILCLFFMTIITKPFNYQKMVIFQSFLLLMDFWAIFISTTFYLISLEENSAAPLVVGLFIIFFIGSKISGRASEVFVSDDPNAIAELIKFQFSSNLNRLRPDTNYLEDKSEISMNHSNKYELVDRRLD